MSLPKTMTRPSHLPDLGHGSARGIVVAVALALCAFAATAAPGAHGPDGEHLDVAVGAAATAASRPRMEAHSELFELVADLRHDALVIHLDRFESNEPVSGARVEVAAGALRATAQAGAQPGDYLVDDAALLAALAAPGEHGLVFTLSAGDDADLLSGVLHVAARGAAAHAAADDHAHHEL